MENQFFVDSEHLSPEALAKKHRIENDPTSRKNHMEYLPGMEIIESDVCSQVMAQMNSYDYSKYTARDVRATLEHPATLSHAEHHKSMFPLLVFSAIMLIAIVLFQNYYKVVLGIGVAFIVVYLVVDYFRKQKSINNVSIENYEIKAECVSFVKEEIYSTDHKIHLSPTVKKIHTAQIYIMFFDNGKTWNIPKNNYAWSGEFPMSDDFIYKNTHFGDIFWTVTEKNTGKIVVAYPTEYFEYKK